MNLFFFHSKLQNYKIHLVVLAVGLIFFLPIYLTAAMAQTNTYLTELGFIEQLWILWAWVVNFVFSNLATFILLCTIQLSLIFMILVWGKPNLIIKLGLVLNIIAIILIPFIYFYQPVVAIKAGYQGQVLTLPYGLNSVVKRAQLFTEIQPCDYTLLGWATDTTLYYQENCSDNSQIWAYQPVTQLLQSVDTLPDNLVTQYQAYGDIKGLHIISDSLIDSFTWQAILGSRIYVSPNTKWQSAVVHHLYGPADVIVWTTSIR